MSEQARAHFASKAAKRILSLQPLVFSFHVLCLADKHYWFTCPPRLEQIVQVLFTRQLQKLALPAFLKWLTSSISGLLKQYTAWMLQSECSFCHHQRFLQSASKLTICVLVLSPTVPLWQFFVYLPHIYSYIFFSDFHLNWFWPAYIWMKALEQCK